MYIHQTKYLKLNQMKKSQQSTLFQTWGYYGKHKQHEQGRENPLQASVHQQQTVTKKRKATGKCFFTAIYITYKSHKNTFRSSPIAPLEFKKVFSDVF